MFSFFLTALLGGAAHAGTSYQITVTNGGAMPVSPAVIYVLDGQAPLSDVGTEASPSFVALCQRGDAAARLMELQMNPRVKSVVQTKGLLMPGQSVTATVALTDPAKQSLHVETMYGKTKEVCGVIHTSGNDLLLEPGAVKSGSDSVVESGAFSSPAFPMGSMSPMACDGTADAVSCLRSLSTPVMGKPRIRSFTGYLPRLLQKLEEKYGTAEAQTLLVPTGGALRYQIERF